MKINIGIGKDNYGWDQKFKKAISEIKISGFDVDTSFVDLDTDEFIANVKNFQVILWKPPFMGNKLAGLYKEKVYFLEKFLGITVFPSFETIWHFESKIAQSYFFKKENIPTPKTYVTFNYYDAKKIINDLDYPVVKKDSEGAASRNVKLVNSRKQLLNQIQKIFCFQLWNEFRQNHSLQKSICSNFYRRWFLYLLHSLVIKNDFPYGVLYLQDFIPKNEADLRITIIGKKYAFGFWRNNRPGDFRASGSGKIDYEREIPIGALRLCQQINNKYGFDSMAYDILLKENKYFINEISYGYKDIALFNAPGYFVVDNEIHFIREHTWPQTLWVKALYEKLLSVS